MVICAGKIEQFDFATPVGIGLGEVVITLTEQSLRQKPDFLLFVGTAGSYGKKEIFEIVTSRSATQIEQSFATGGAYTPLKELTEGITSRSCPDFEHFDVSRETIVNSSNYITTNESVGEWYLKRGIEIENMEFYAVLQVAKRFDIPAMGVFVVTNYCDRNAHRDFLKNHHEAMERVTGFVEELGMRN